MFRSVEKSDPGGLSDVIGYINHNVVVFDLMEHSEFAYTISLLKCWPAQSMSHLCHTGLPLRVVMGHIYPLGHASVNSKHDICIHYLFLFWLFLV